MSTASSLALPPPPHYMLAQASLFLDLDGTLIEIASRPQDVKVDDELISLLADLNDFLQGRLVVVSGRPAGELRALLRELPLAMAGSHGVELLFADGREARPATMPPPPRMMSWLRLLMEEHAGVLIENKPYGVAIHHRLAPDAASACLALASRIAAEEGLQLQPGKQVIELKYHKANKGDAVRAFMSVAPSRDGTPLFIGDDLTDEEGFMTARALGGVGVLVGDRNPTEATFRLPDVLSTLGWLRRAIGGGA